MQLETVHSGQVLTTKSRSATLSNMPLEHIIKTAVNPGRPPTRAASVSGLLPPQHTVVMTPDLSAGVLGCATRLMVETADADGNQKLDEAELASFLTKILKASGQDAGAAQRVLEINPRHPLVASLATEISSAPGSTRAEQVADLLFDMALVVEGEAPRNPGTFAKSLAQVLDGALKG